MKRLEWIGLIAFITAAILAFSATPLSTSLTDLELSATDISSMLVHLFIVALLIERLSEVIIFVYRKPGRQKLENELIGDTPADAKYKEINEKLAEYAAKTGRLSFTIGFTVGIALGLSGIRILSELYLYNDLSGWQNSLFELCDILLTAGLLAGGSDGIHKVTSNIDAYLSLLKSNTLNLQNKQGS